MQTFDIEDLNFEEKMILMERLWDELSKEDENAVVPSWHLEVLSQREKKDSYDFDSLENVKKRLQQRV